MTKAVKFHFILYLAFELLLNGILSQFDFDLHNLNTYEQPNSLWKTKWFFGPWWLNMRAFWTNWLCTKSFINVKNKRIPYKWFKLLSTKQSMCCHSKIARQQHDWEVMIWLSDRQCHLGQWITVHFLHGSTHIFVTMETRSNEVRGQQSSRLIC